ncbi:ankyrin repeat and SOCS box protein 10 isoform 3-T5 [Morphnus guianensis]
MSRSSPRLCTSQPAGATQTACGSCCSWELPSTLHQGVRLPCMRLVQHPVQSACACCSALVLTLRLSLRMATSPCTSARAQTPSSEFCPGDTVGLPPPRASSYVEGVPTHPCRCVRQLLQHGASVNSRTEEEDDTALHIAARHGLTDHVQLLLRYGAELEAKNEEGQTPLNAACAQPHQPQDMDRYYRVCQLLVESGASINAADRDRQRPLHLACKNANAQVAELLLARGANVNVMNYSGNTALHNILQATAYKLEHHPELVVRALLNYGAIRIWPGSLLKVLRYCHACPRVIEALMNSYDHVRISEDWVEAVPAEVVQKYPRFYESLFSLEQRPRSLQHLARCALRTFLEGRLLLVLSQLHLPRALHRFLLLSFEDVLY